MANPAAKATSNVIQNRAGASPRRDLRPLAIFTNKVIGCRAKKAANAAAPQSATSADHDPPAAVPTMNGPVSQIQAPCSGGRIRCLLRSRRGLSQDERLRVWVLASGEVNSFLQRCDRWLAGKASYHGGIVAKGDLRQVRICALARVKGHPKS